MTARHRLTLGEQVVIYRKQAICPVCGQPLGERTVHFDHGFALARGGRDEVENIRAIHYDPCHRVKTFGTKATTLGSDIHEAAKTKRLTKEHLAFQSLVLRKEPGKPRVKTGRIRSRGFDRKQRKFNGRMERRIL